MLQEAGQLQGELAAAAAPCPRTAWSEASAARRHGVRIVTGSTESVGVAICAGSRAQRHTAPPFPPRPGWTPFSAAACVQVTLWSWWGPALREKPSCVTSWPPQPHGKATLSPTWTPPPPSRPSASWTLPTSAPARTRSPPRPPHPAPTSQTSLSPRWTQAHWRLRAPLTRPRQRSPPAARCRPCAASPCTTSRARCGWSRRSAPT